MTVTNRLGEQKEVTLTFSDGWYQCPFCMYPTQEPCKNPACEMNMHPIQIEAQRRRRTQEEKEKEGLRELARYEIERYEKKREQRLALLREATSEAELRGACTNFKCLFPRGLDGNVRYTKHRKVCPNG